MRSGKKLSFTGCTLAGIICAILLLILDQFTKYLAIIHLKGKQAVSLIPGVLELKYLENRGMAFGLMQGKITLFAAVCLLFLIFAVYAYMKVPKNIYYLPMIAVGFLIISGAVGNFIDRIIRGYVVDFIYVVLIDFPVFNVADIYVVCGGILLVLLAVFKYKDEDFDFLSRKKRA